MKTTNCLNRFTTLIVALIALIGLWAVPARGQSPTPTPSPTPGTNAVFNSTGSAVVRSLAFFDATPFASTSTTLCRTIYNILNSAAFPKGVAPGDPPGGAVIDARGLNTGNSNFTCATSESPWFNGTTYLNYPSVILLPAGTITISYTWLLPNNTRVIGQGASTPVTSGTQIGTVITAASGFTGPASTVSPALAMIQFGEPSSTLTCNSGICFNISIEDVTLNNALSSGAAANANLDGILNLNSQELTYAKRVNLYGITGTGLQINLPRPANCSGPSCNYPFQAQNSGPYQEISYNVPSGITGQYCAQIYGAGIRGLHGIKCNGNSGTAGILLDSSSNSIEDVYVNGFIDGILVGSQPSTLSLAWGNLLANISGGASVTNLVHIVCGAASPSSCPSNELPRDITILGVESSNSSSTTYSIVDEIGIATLPTSTDASVGMYVLGEPLSGGNSRFTTSSTVPTWFVGTQAPSFPCSIGSIYTATATSVSTGTLFGCLSTGWAKEK